MRPTRILGTFLFLLAAMTPASAADLTKIDRTLKHEPTYRSSSPKYCLLVFGPEAKTHVWLVVDQDVMHVYDSPAGSSPKAWRQVRGRNGNFHLGDVCEADGKTRHKNLAVYLRSWGSTVEVKIAGKSLQMADQDRGGELKFAAKAKDAPIIHFNGPLTLDLFHGQKPLKSGGKVRLSAVLGTPGVGPGSFAYFTTDAFYDYGWPTAEVEFPSKEPGGKPTLLRVRLDND
jgi:hypothetical protein